MMKKYIHFDGKFNFAALTSLEFRSTELCRNFSTSLCRKSSCRNFSVHTIVLPFSEVVQLQHYISLFTPNVDAAAAQVVVMAMNKDGSQRQWENKTCRKNSSSAKWKSMRESLSVFRQIQQQQWDFLCWGFFSCSENQGIVCIPNSIRASTYSFSVDWMHCKQQSCNEGGEVGEDCCAHSGKKQRKAKK